MPSVLIELGYISNRAEEKYLNSEQGQKLWQTLSTMRLQSIKRIR